VLHKYHQIKSPKEGEEDEEELRHIIDDEKDTTKRYAENFDKYLKDEQKTRDDFVTLTKTITEKTLKTEDIELNGRSKGNFANTLFVPFQVLTSIERDNNWVNVNTDDKSKLPEVPSLQQDGNFARELPKPFGKIKKTLFNSNEDQ
jgi:hypothetical protein